MKRIKLILFVLIIASFSVACAETPVPIEQETYFEDYTADISTLSDADIFEDDTDYGQDLAAYGHLSFLTLDVITDASVMEIGETFTIMGLSFQFRPHYSVLVESDALGSLRSLDDVNVIVSTMLTWDGLTTTEVVEMLITDAMSELEILEDNELEINGILWRHRTVAYNFEELELFQTILVTEKDDIVYIFSYVAPRDQLQDLRADRSLMISSLRIKDDFDSGMGNLQTFLPDDAVADERLLVDSDNWQFFFQENSYEDTIKFARRFAIAKTDNDLTNAFFESFSVYESEAVVMRNFSHDGNNFYILEFYSPVLDSDYAFNSLTVMHEDFLIGLASMDFSHYNPHVSIEIPSDAIISRTQAAVDIFSDLLHDYNRVRVTAENFNTAEDLMGPFAMFDPSNYAVRDDGFSQITWKMTGETISVDFIVLILIYDDYELIGAMLTPGNSAY